MERISDKTKRKNWIDGDTFAVEIKNQSEKYNGKYLILIKTINEIWKKNCKSEETYERVMRNSPVFYVKITSSKNIPKTLKEINNLEFIKNYVIYTSPKTNNRFDKGKFSEPDEFNYTYDYVYELLFHRGFDFDSLKYIGNFKIDFPPHEFIPIRYYEIYSYHTKFDWIGKLLENYEEYNMGKSFHFTDEGKKTFANRYQANIDWLESSLSITRERVNKNKELYLYGWGTGLYDCETALEVRKDYKKYLRNSKKNNQEFVAMIQELCEYYTEYINDSIDGPVFWMVVAHQQIQGNNLFKEIKEKALASIDVDLKNWKNKTGYLLRKKELDFFKEKLNNYNCEE